ncbi:MAG: VWA domain-containing protein [Clostridia bacterium]|nr:VWA domain-containing protein [Clostridia bacterium]
MRKIGILLLVILLILSGCSHNNENNTNTSNIDVTFTDEGGVNTVENGDTADSIDTAKDDISVEPSLSTDGEERSSGESKSSSTEDSHGKDELNNQQVVYGHLTAGMWNDNENYDFFKNILNDNEWYNMMSYWQFVNWSRYEFIVKNNNDEPLNQVKIDLHDEQGNIFYTGITNNKGVSILYPFINQIFIQNPKLQATITTEKNQYEIVDFDEFASTINVKLNEEPKSIENLEVMFMIDTTGSMGDELSYIQNELEYVITEIKQNQNVSVNLSVNFYRDYGDEYLIRDYPFSNDLNNVLSILNQQNANGGGDYEEAVVEALENGINHQWQYNTTKLMFLILDAPPHHTTENITKIHELIKSANAKGIRIIPVASSGVDKSTEFLLRFINMTTGGTYIFLTDHSGIGNSHITPTIGQYKVYNLNELLIEVITSYIE